MKKTSSGKGKEQLGLFIGSEREKSSEDERHLSNIIELKAHQRKEFTTIPKDVLSAILEKSRKLNW